MMAELVGSSINRRSFHSSGTVEYELVQSTRRRQVEYGIEESIIMTSRDRREELGEGNSKPRGVKRVYSTESQFVSRTSQQQLLSPTSNNKELTSVGEEDKNRRTQSGSSACMKALLLMVLCGIIVGGIIALVIGALAVRYKLCASGDEFSLSCNTRQVENNDQELLTEQLSSLREQVQELRDFVSSNNNSFSAVVDSRPIYEGCKARVKTCRAAPVAQDFFDAASNRPVCSTGRVNIEGFHAVGAHCTITRKKPSSSVDQDAFNERLISETFQKQMIVKPVMSTGGRRISCECYFVYNDDFLRLTATSIELLGEVQCLLNVTLCPLSPTTTLNITKIIL